MKTILITNQKGGVGKSMLCDELCYAADRDSIIYNLYDLDQQGSLTHEEIERKDAAVAFVDTPGALQEDMSKWIEAADLIIIPTLLTRKDLVPLERMIEIMEPYKGKKEFLYVLNEWDHTNMTKDFIAWFEEKYPDCKTFIVSRATAFPQADACGKSIVEFNPRCSGSKQIQGLWAYIKMALNLREGWR